ncbi:MAG: polyribonucleotide nucleotidyltransferase [bacterium]|nr:polyribonucleotide nucleotidyltransferase [bacterium]
MAVDISVEIGKEELKFNTGYLAKQADGAVLVTYGETIVFASAVASKEVKEGQDFFPLMVDYREKTYAAGKIPGGFIKRESRPSDRETLVCRLTDRPLRPLFPKGFINDVQIIIYVLSADRVNQQDILAINAASAALSISGMPFHGPVGAVRVGRIDGNWIVNPSFEESDESDIDIVVAGTRNAVTMIEGSAKNVSEEAMLEAVEFAHENIKKICDALDELKAAVAKPEMEYTTFLQDETLKSELKDKYYSEIKNLTSIKEKKEREEAFTSIVEKAKKEMAEKYPDYLGQMWPILDGFDGECVREEILENGKRADGRGLKDIRAIDSIVGLLPRAHGSAVFTRGQTQSLGITTLGNVSDAQRLDNIEGEKEKRFMLHYQFPPFSVGETGRTGGVGRREIGHGMLAERALEYVIPDAEKFPYTIRQVSETLESNGSSSMATVCSGSLAMFNAGVPLKAAVAGIAMGLVMEEDRFAVLSDILGLEDHLGDMDFKVAGTETGITAFQLDIKIEGITTEIMKNALAQAKEGRLHILGKMKEVLAKPEDNLSDYAPKMKMIMINPEKIGEVIGPGGKIIRKIIEESGASVNVENDGSVVLSSMDYSSIEAAERYILGIVEEIEVGRIYDATVKKIVDFGAFCEVAPGKEGLCHISNLDFGHVRNVTDILNVGDKLKVKVIKIDKQGRIDLSRKEALKK